MKYLLIITLLTSAGDVEIALIPASHQIACNQAAIDYKEHMLDQKNVEVRTVCLKAGGNK